ncbi:unnamed protein product [Scytosiphon promiscuus]
MSRIHRDQRLEEDAAAKLEAMKAIPPEDRARVQEMTEAFLNTPLGAQYDSMNMFLQEKDPDAMMLNLGLPLSDGHPRKITGGTLPGENGSLLSSGVGGHLAQPATTLHSGEEAGEASAAQAQAAPPHTAAPASANSSTYIDGVTGGAASRDAIAGSGTRPMFSEEPPTPVRPPQQAFGMNGYPSPFTTSQVDPSLTVAGGGGGGRNRADDFNFLVRTLGAHRKFEEARAKVVPEMMRRGIRPTGGTLAALLAGAGVNKNPDAAEEVWREMVQMGVRPTAYAWAARVDAHARGGRMRRALQLGKEMRDLGYPWEVMTYTSLIAGCTRKKNYTGAWNLWQEMIKWGVQPDAMAYNTMIKLCAETRQYERAMTFIDEMDMKDIRPSRITMESLIRAAATAPQWIRAYGGIVDDLVQRFIGLGVTPETDTYRALLVAYGNGGDADKVLQCIEEAHLLVGHTADLIGDGTPKLPYKAYCDALVAIAKCNSVGRHRGTRPRWGTLAGQDALVMDISAVDVPEEDFDRVRQMQMSTMEWDESGEAALKKGFRKGKRIKFMGITTPKDIIGDEEYERAIEDEYERVVKKAKAIKEMEARENLLQLGIDPDEEEKVAKTRPRVLPDPSEREPIGAPVPHWLTGEDPDAYLSGSAPPMNSSAQQEQEQLRISDGIEGPDGGAGESRGMGVRERSWELEEESWGKKYLSAQEQSPKRRGGDVASGGPAATPPRGREGTPGGVFKRVTMLDLLEGDQSRGEDGRGGSSSKGELEAEGGGDGLALPDNLEEMMEEGVSTVREEPEAQADTAFEQMMAEAVARGEEEEQQHDDGSDIDVAFSFNGDGEGEGSALSADSGEEDDDTNLVHDGSSLMDQLEKLQLQRENPDEDDQVEKQEKEEEYEGWTPLMHEDINVRTRALMGVVGLLETDAMAAARAADAEKGFAPEQGAGPAVRETLYARLKTLTEARSVKKAMEFVDEEYPKEGAKLDVEATLAVVEMFINTRKVELAEEFEQKQREGGLAPNRSRILAAILNARARRAVAWTQEIGHVRRVLDTMQKLRIKPNENELRFVRQLVDKGRFEHSWLPADPNAHVKRMKLEVKKSRPVSKSFFKVVSKMKNAKFMQGTGRGKSRIE